jgi:PhoPQ-activated pathogenicity-related protein
MDWFNDGFQKKLDEGLPRDEAVAALYPGWAKTQEACEVIPVEKAFIELIRSWQDKGIGVMAVSSRQTSVIDSTEKQLKSIGVDLSKTAPIKGSGILEFPFSAVYKNGVLYLTGYLKKGELIKQFFEETGLKPSKVIFFDDKKYNVKALAKGVRSLGIEMLGVHYRAIERQPKIYDPKLAKIQHCYFGKFGKILSNEEAALPLAGYLMDEELFSWKAIEKEDHPDYTVHLLEVTSQQWGKGEVTDPLWKHYMRVTLPKTLKVAKSFFYVGGGKSGEKVWQTPPELLKIALETQTILTELRAVPNQPLQFIGESKQRKEDQIIARTWRNFLEKKNSEYPLHFPMARAVVRGIDALEAYLEESEGQKLEGVVLCGESKRAWAAWLAAAYDDRVKGLIPVVCDFLNVEACFTHHFQSLGTFSPAIRDYLEEGINEQWFGKKEFHDLMQLEDPFVYRKRYTMPKLQINASGDPFSMPDSSQFSFKELPSPKYLCYLPNTGHYLGNSAYAAIAKGFYNAILMEKPLPEFSWKRTEKGDLRIETKTKPLEVKLWKAHNPEARDFRLDFTKRTWTAQTLACENGICQTPLVAENEGWTAYFAELLFEGGLSFTTEIYILD